VQPPAVVTVPVIVIGGPTRSRGCSGSAPWVAGGFGAPGSPVRGEGAAGGVGSAAGVVAIGVLPSAEFVLGRADPVGESSLLVGDPAAEQPDSATTISAAADRFTIFMCL
jgi:hypothetical protein